MDLSSTDAIIGIIVLVIWGGLCFWVFAIEIKSKADLISKILDSLLALSFGLMCLSIAIAMLKHWFM